MNCVWATTQSAVYVAMKHIFPEVPINAGCFAPLRIPAPERTFLYAQYPRPVAGCAAEVAQRIMEAVFGAMGQAMPERMFASPAGTSGNLALGGWDPDRGSGYIMYFFSGGAYGGWWETDGLTNGCSSVGISKTQPVEILEQHYPLLFEEYALREAQAEPAATVAALASTTASACSAAKEGFLPHGPRANWATRLMGGTAGATNEIEISQADYVTRPEHISKGEGYLLRPGDWIQVRTPGGGGYGSRADRDPKLVERDLRRGYFRKEHELPAERDDQSAA